LQNLHDIEDKFFIESWFLSILVWSTLFLCLLTYLFKHHLKYFIFTLLLYIVLKIIFFFVINENNTYFAYSVLPRLDALLAGFVLYISIKNKTYLYKKAAYFVPGSILLLLFFYLYKSDLIDFTQIHIAPLALIPLAVIMYKCNIPKRFSSFLQSFASIFYLGYLIQISILIICIKYMLHQGLSKPILVISYVLATIVISGFLHFILNWIKNLIRHSKYN